MTMMGRCSSMLVVAVVLAVCVSSFQWTIQPANLSGPRHHSLPTRLWVSKKDADSLERILPETSFGSEEVPVDQRPVNEYLNVLRQPMFDWASNESGTTGLATRLLVLYSVVFGIVCYPIAGASKSIRKVLNFALTIFCVGEIH
jgi:Conserved in the green lineage and diatoms 27